MNHRAGRGSGSLQGSRDGFTRKQWLLLALPAVLTVTMVWVFRTAVAQFGFEMGYLLGFLVYWVLWCSVVPVVLLGGPAGLRDLFRAGEPRFGHRPRITVALLVWGPLVVLAVRFLPGLSNLTLPIVLVSVLIASVIGFTEEVLWRGTFVRLFPDSRTLGYLYPSLGFAVWHVAPLSVHGNSMPGGTYSFVAYSLVFGLSLGYYTWQTGSIRWATGVHVLHDFLGLPGFLWLGLLASVG